MSHSVIDIRLADHRHPPHARAWSALRTYEREGFANYQLDSAFGSAMFPQKKL